MHPSNVIATLLLWAVLVFATRGLDELPSHCKNMTEKCESFIGDNTTIICCHLNKRFLIKENLIGKHIKNLYIYNASMSNLTLQIDSPVETLSITGGNITIISINGSFNNINCLNLSNNHLKKIKVNGSMPKLRMIDFSNNNLTDLPDKANIFTLVHNVTNVTIDISGNRNISCNSVEWLLDAKYSIQLKNKDISYCSLQKSFDWFNSEFTISLPHLRTAQCEDTLETRNCRCGIFRYIPPADGNPLLILLNVNCSNLQLKSLPQRLPPLTVSLDVSNNNITSLDQMKNSSYSGVRMLYAHNNFISTISVLEGTPFMSNFSVLDMRWNNLSSVPTYFLSNRLDRNIASKIYLGGNKLLCDCNTAQILKLWLSLHKKFVEDYEEIGCRNLPKSVMQLDQLDVCLTQRTWTDYIYYIIAGEVTLLIFLVSKVSYDYWVFKTAGYLPWPASKMPKLPCDWVFET